MAHERRPLSEAERVANLLAALCVPDDDEESEAMIEAEAEASGIDFEAWAAELCAKVEAQLAKERCAREEARRREGVKGVR